MVEVRAREREREHGLKEDPAAKRRPKHEQAPQAEERLRPCDAYGDQHGGQEQRVVGEEGGGERGHGSALNVRQGREGG